MVAAVAQEENAEGRAARHWAAARRIARPAAERGDEDSAEKSARVSVRGMVGFSSCARPLTVGCRPGRAP